MHPSTAGSPRAQGPADDRRRDTADDAPAEPAGGCGPSARTAARPDGERWTPLPDVPPASDPAAAAGLVSVAAPPDPRPLDRVAAGLPRPRRPRPAASDDDGSLVTEYGLLAILGATAVSLVLKFLSGGALFELFGAVLGRVRALVGA